MSTEENQLNLEGELHYIFDQDFILDENLSNVLYADDAKVMLVDGQYYLTDSQGIFFRPESPVSSYYIDNNEGAVVVQSDTPIETKNDDGTTEIVQFIEEDTSGNQQIIYYTDGDTDGKTELGIIPQEGDEEQHEQITEIGDTNSTTTVTGFQDDDGNIYPFKRLKLEVSNLALDELLIKEHHDTITGTTTKYAIIDENPNINNEETNKILYTQTEENVEQQEIGGEGGEEYTIVGEAKEGEIIEIDGDGVEEQDQPIDMIDFSKIIGHNLITGQTITLDSYMEKLKKKLNTNDISRYCKKIPNNCGGGGGGSSGNQQVGTKNESSTKLKQQLNELLDKKITIGKTKTGKKIVGKVIHVGRKEETTETTVQEDSQADVTEDDDELEMAVPDKLRISPENLEQVSRTLSGVMEMESIQKKLENRNIIVKLIEKNYTMNSYLNCIKKVSYCLGYMEKDTASNNTTDNSDKWNFIIEDNDEHIQNTNNYPPPATTITIIITQKLNGTKTIRVNLNPNVSNLCTLCLQSFKCSQTLRNHMFQVHSISDGKKLCELCGEIFSDAEQLKEHRTVHVEEGKLFICTECNKCFSSQTRLQRHLPVHDVYLRPLECSVCKMRCATEWSLKKHLLIHTGIKPFACGICYKQFSSEYDVNFHKKIHFPEKHFLCNICFRTFSRHSNLIRHKEIHKSSGPSYKCDICFCSYNYISSLTRHMVQNHIDANEFRKFNKT